VTVIWHCNDRLACSTGRLVEVGADFIEVHGPVPTFGERRSCEDCDDMACTDLDTGIRLCAICAVVQDVPECRKAGLPTCCGERRPNGD
jgi:hypothetical protein